VERPVHVFVPATSANLGPGYDCLGLALDWHDEFRAQIVPAGLTVSVEGAHADAVPRDASHLVVRAMALGFAAMGIEMAGVAPAGGRGVEGPGLNIPGLNIPGLKVPGLKVHCVNAVPHARGLGSSASAIIGGLCLARGLVADPSVRLDDRALLDIAAELEGHPDNVGAALLGGLVISGERAADEIATSRPADRYFAHTSPVHADLVATVFIPDFEVETKTARTALPALVPHRDAAANTARAALLIAAAATSPELLFTATRDYLHQDYRESMMPHTLGLVRRLRRSGFAAMVSGAGPAVLALGTTADATSAARQTPEHWRCRIVPIDLVGARTSY
jgi:homoserine kinase